MFDSVPSELSSVICFLQRMYRTWWALLIILWPTVQGQWMRRKTAILEGDMTIGYLFSMHEQPDQKSAHTRNCGKIWEEYGIQRAEVTFQTIDQINKDDRLLPNITLGVEIRDDCWSVTFNIIFNEMPHVMLSCRGRHFGIS